MKKLAERWYLVIVFGFLGAASLVFALCGENSIIAVHDNLDLFIPQYQMMKQTGTFFSQGAEVPFLGGISRDVLPGEFSLYTLLYVILPAYPAYVAGYLLKVIIGLASCILLAGELLGEKYGEYKPLVWILGLAYGALNVFPNFGICFASIPLVIDLLCKICRDPKVKWYVLLFCYPFLSYFSYFGLFILGYMALFFLWILGRTVYLKKKNAARREDSKLPLRVFLAVCALASGCIVWEYRLFRVMLLGDEVTIRSTMEAGSFTLGEIVRTILEVFAKGRNLRKT